MPKTRTEPAPRDRGMRAARTIALGAMLLAQGASAAPQAPPLDVSRYEMTFEDRFDVPDIVAKPPFSAAPFKARWLAHTPWFGDFGDSYFGDPSATGPFAFGPDGLTVTSERMPDGRWRGGLVASVDRDGPGQQGFSQQYGYFEMRARLPKGPGDWSGFWLVGTDKSKVSSEIDVIEYYGHVDDRFRTTLHIWSKDGKSLFGEGHDVLVSPDSLSSKMNDFGVEVGPERTVFYLNRVPYLDVPTPPEYRQPMYMLANLAVGGGWPSDRLASPQSMQVAYVRAYRRKAP